MQTNHAKKPKPKQCCVDLCRLLPPKLFKALCDPNRVAILSHLARATSCTVSEVAECCPINLSVVSRHLAQLREAGILRAVKRGKEVHYSVCTDELVRTLRAIADAVEQCCPDLVGHGAKKVKTACTGRLPKEGARK